MLTLCEWELKPTLNYGPFTSKHSVQSMIAQTRYIQPSFCSKILYRTQKAEDYNVPSAEESTQQIFSCPLPIIPNTKSPLHCCLL